MTARPDFIAGPALAVAMLFVACSSDTTTTPTSSTPAQSTTSASIGGDACTSADGGTGTSVTAIVSRPIELDTTSVEAGPTAFTVTNHGPGAHELVVLRTDLAPDKLPLTDDRTEANEKAPGVALIGKTDLINAGCTTSITLDLQKGDYVLICNLPALPGGRGHYEQGMVAPPFTVT